MEIQIDAARAGRWLAGLVVFCALAHLISHAYVQWIAGPPAGAFAKRFYLNGEFTVPATYSALLFLACAFQLAAIGAHSRKNGEASLGWSALAVIFLFLAFDEYFSIHESISRPLRVALNTSGPFFYAWIIPYGAAVLALGLIYLRFLARLPARSRRLFVLSAAIFLGGAIGMEMVGGWYYDTVKKEDILLQVVIVGLEETMELAGLSLFTYALLRHIEVETGEIELFT